MPEEAGTMEQADWEKRYKDLQAEYTRAAQEAAQMRKRVESGELFDWEGVRRYASENPGAVAEYLGIQKAAGGQGATQGASEDDLISRYGDEVFDPNSDAYRRFVEENTQRGLRQLAVRKHWLPEVMRASGLDEKFKSQEQKLQELEQVLQATQQRLQQAEQWGIAAWDEARMTQDPVLKDVREIQQQFRSDDPKAIESAWRKLAEDRRKLQELQAKLSAQPVASPDEAAAAISAAEGVPGGAGLQPGQPASQAGLDPFEAAVRKAQEGLNRTRVA